MYRVEFTRRAERELRELIPDIQTRVAEAVKRLEQNPRPPGCKKLHGEKSLWRVRVGDFRIVYRVHDDVLQVLVIKIGNRKDVYQ
jgi:mRNA interferase RelE/StbE